MRNTIHQQNCLTMLQYLVENYAVSARGLAILRLGHLSLSFPTYGGHLDQHFYHDLDHSHEMCLGLEKETGAQIFWHLSPFDRLEFPECYIKKITDECIDISNKT